MTGVIDHERLNGFERVLWRITRGNLYMRSSPIEERIEDPKTVPCPALPNYLLHVLLFEPFPNNSTLTGRDEGQVCVHSLLPRPESRG